MRRALGSRAGLLIVFQMGLTGDGPSQSRVQRSRWGLPSSSGIQTVTARGSAFRFERPPASAGYPRDPRMMRNHVRARLAAQVRVHARRRRDSHLQHDSGKWRAAANPSGLCTRECTALPIPWIGTGLGTGLGGPS